MTHPYSLTQEGPSEFEGNNYYMKVMKDDEHVMNLWAFDSNEDICLGVKGWGCVDPLAIDYFEKINQKKANIAFMHIPMQEYLDLSHFDIIRGT